MKKKMKEVVINDCFGGFSLSNLAYEELIKLGVPVRKYIKEERNPETDLYDIKNPNNVLEEVERLPKYDLSNNGIDGEFYIKLSQIKQIIKNLKA